MIKSVSDIFKTWQKKSDKLGLIKAPNIYDTFFFARFRPPDISALNVNFRISRAKLCFEKFHLDGYMGTKNRYLN